MTVPFIEVDLNNRFEKAMFNLLRSFNFIEINVGLLIALIPNLGKRSDILKKLAKLTFKEKMTWFDSLLEESDLAEHIGPKGIAEFRDWFVNAHQARELRNQYVHAIWRFNPGMIGAPVQISSPEWMSEVYGDKTTENMSLEQLESKVAMVEKVFIDFKLIRKQYIF